MWFFLQKNPKEKHRLFGLLIALSGLLHGGLCIGCFIVGRLIGSQRVVYAMNRTVRVSMRSGGLLNGGALSPSSGQGTSLQQNGPANEPSKTETPLGAAGLKELATPVPAVKEEPVPDLQEQKLKTAAIQPASEKEIPSSKKAPVTPKQGGIQPNKKESNQKANVPAQTKKSNAPAKPDIPLFSAYKRPVRKGAAQKQQPSSAQTSQQTSQKTESVLNEGEAPLYSVYKRKAPQASVEQPKEAASKSSLPEKTAQEQGPAPQSMAGSGSSQGTSSPGTAAGGQGPEIVPFVLEEGSISDHEIVQEIWRHYRRPPGFEEHEPFVFTFEIKQRKALSVGPRGKEPLIIYTAIKDAVLKATFMHSNFSKRVELVIT